MNNISRELSQSVELSRVDRQAVKLFFWSGSGFSKFPD